MDHDQDRPEAGKTVAMPGRLLEGRLAVVSDVHLRSLDDDRGRLLLDLLARTGPGLECLVLNGDIFDFCYGFGPYFQAKFRALGTALTAVARRGTRVLFVEGNHEYHLTAIGWESVEIITAKDVEARLADGSVMCICHGDLLGNEPLYRLFRAVMKSAVAKWLARLVPGRWLDLYALKHARISRSRDKYRKLDHGRILGAIDTWLGNDGSRHGIIGHFHVPYAEQRRGAAGMMLSVESWDRPNVLVYGDGGFKRAYLSAPGAAFRLEPAESLFGRR